VARNLQSLECSVAQKRVLVMKLADACALQLLCEVVGLAASSYYYQPQPRDDTAYAGERVRQVQHSAQLESIDQPVELCGGKLQRDGGERRVYVRCEQGRNAAGAGSQSYGYIFSSMRGNAVASRR
jgi:hypothetical protein